MKRLLATLSLVFILVSGFGATAFAQSMSMDGTYHLDMEFYPLNNGLTYAVASGTMTAQTSGDLGSYQFSWPVLYEYLFNYDGTFSFLGYIF